MDSEKATTTLESPPSSISPTYSSHEGSKVPPVTKEDDAPPKVVTPTHSPEVTTSVKRASVKLFQHQDVQSQAKGRMAELEELRNKKLTKKLGKEISETGNENAPISTPVLADFFLKQNELNKEWKKKQNDSRQYLHSYRDKASPNKRASNSPYPAKGGYTTMNEMDAFFQKQREDAKKWREQYKDSQDYLHKYKDRMTREKMRGSGPALVSPGGSVEEDEGEQFFADAFADMKRYLEESLSEAVVCPLPESPEQSCMPLVSAKSEEDTPSLPLQEGEKPEISAAVREQLSHPSLDEREPIPAVSSIPSSEGEKVTLRENPSDKQEAAEHGDSGVLQVDEAPKVNQETESNPEEPRNDEDAATDVVSKDSVEPIAMEESLNTDLVAPEGDHSKDEVESVENQEEHPHTKKDETPSATEESNDQLEEVETDKQNDRDKEDNAENANDTTLETEEDDSHLLDEDDHDVVVANDAAKDVAEEKPANDMGATDTEQNKDPADSGDIPLSNVREINENIDAVASGNDAIKDLVGEAAKDMIILEKEQEGDESTGKPEDKAQVQAPGDLEAIGRRGDKVGEAEPDSTPVEEKVIETKETERDQESGANATPMISTAAAPKTCDNNDGKSKVAPVPHGTESQVVKSKVTTTVAPAKGEKEKKASRAMRAPKAASSPPKKKKVQKTPKSTPKTIRSSPSKSEKTASPAKGKISTPRKTQPRPPPSKREKTASPAKEKVRVQRSTPPRPRVPSSPQKARPKTPPRPNPQEVPSVCTAKWVPDLHPSAGGCEQCLNLVSQGERDMYFSNGHHHRIMTVHGGCAMGCSFFPRLKNEPAVRLCRKCFYDVHVLSRGAKSPLSMR